MRRKDDWVSASQVGDAAFCHKSVELSLHGDLDADSDARREKGTAAHDLMGRVVEFQGALLAVGLGLLLVALLIFMGPSLLDRIVP